MSPTQSAGRTPGKDQRPELAGYSSSPQHKKLGLGAGRTYLLWNAPTDWRFEEPIDDARRIEDTDAGQTPDLVLAFATDPAHIVIIGNELAPSIFPDGSLWIAWPRKAAGHRSDVTEQLLRDILLPMGIVDTKVAAIDRDWSGLKFVWRKGLRSQPSAAKASASYMGIDGC